MYYVASESGWPRVPVPVASQVTAIPPSHHLTLSGDRCSWKDLILPNGRDTRIFLSQIDETGNSNSVSTSSFTPTESWHPDKLPSHIYIVDDLPSEMEGHLRHLLDEHYAKRAARIHFTNDNGICVIPNRVWDQFRNYSPFPLYYEQAAYAHFVSKAVHEIYPAVQADLWPRPAGDYVNADVHQKLTHSFLQGLPTSHAQPKVAKFTEIDQ